MFPPTNVESEWRYGSNGYDYNEYYTSEDVSVSIVKVNVGTEYGQISYSEPIATITGKNDINKSSYNRQPSGDWTDYMRETGGQPFYETDKYYFISTILAYKNSRANGVILSKKVFPNTLYRPKPTTYITVKLGTHIQTELNGST